jgi:hypothetical protein
MKYFLEYCMGSQSVFESIAWDLNSFFAALKAQ